jgi:hypothetical protein
VPGCLEWGEERTSQCSQTEDQGYNECADWDAQCCTWWPCSWACKLITWICVGWTWVSHVVCVAWTWITTAVCVVWDVVTTVVNAVLVTLESILGWVLSALAFVVELIELIPVIGTLVRWILNFVTFLIGSVLSLIDAAAGLIGVRPEKKLRVCPLILSDEDGNAVMSQAQAGSLLQLACDVYKRDANVRILPLAPFQYDSGFAGAEQVTDEWIQVVSGSGDPELLDLPCGGGGAGADWLTAGSKIQWLSSTRCFYGAWRRVLGYGAPITVLFIRSVPGSLGCGLWITDYVTVASAAFRQSPRTAAHELGHACNLWHTCVDDDVDDLMATQDACDPDSTTLPDRANPVIADWQVNLVRASKHVTYF